MAIIVVMTAISIPMFSQHGRTTKINKAALQLTSDINLARQMAITQRQPVHVLFPAEEVPNHSFTRYAVYAPPDGFVGAWRSLPAGVIMSPTGGVYNIFDVGEWVDDVPFSGRVESFLGITFGPDGALMAKDPTATEYFRSIILTEGFIKDDGKPFIRVSGLRYAVEVLAASGQVTGSYLE